MLTLTLMSPAVPAPVAPSERIQTLDILRGFALLGIFIMNMPGFNSSFFGGADGKPVFPAWYDQTAEWVRDVLFSGKFNSLFSFLFGIGFTIQLTRLRSRGANETSVYLRRLLVLFVLGIAHVLLLWGGDVLHIYAVLGLLLLLLRKAPDWAVVTIICLCLLYPTAMGVYRQLHYDKADMQQLIRTVQQRDAADHRIYGHGTYTQSVARHADELRFLYSQMRFFLGFYVSMLATLLLGYLAGRKQWIQRAAEHLPFLRRVQVWSLVIGIICGITFGVISIFHRDPLKPSFWGVVAGTAYAYCRPSLMLFYASTIVLLAQKPVWQKRFTPIALVGRMPLTNYLMQSLIGTAIFYGWGLGFYGKCGPALSLILSLVLYACQVPWSVWWFRHFQYGPMEYLWRTLTYGRAPAMRLPVSLPQTARVSAS